MPSRAIERINFGKIKEIIAPPNLIELQTNSYKEFLQADLSPSKGKILHSVRIIPDRGSWYEAQFDTSDLLYVYLDRKKRRRKFLTTTFFRALAFLEGEAKGKEAEKSRGTDEEILKLFYEIEELN